MKLSVVFPGQGSQSVGMLQELADNFSEISDTFAEASDVLSYDLWQVVAENPGDKLSKTEVTQPAMLSAGIAIYRVYRKVFATVPAMMAGHSLGEYTALVAAEAIDFRSAVKLVEQRGQFMQEAVPMGNSAMAAVLGLDADKVRNICSKVREEGVVEAVNFNSPEQIVIAGNKDAVARVCSLARDGGAKRALLLPVSVPSHSSLMKPAAEKFKGVLENVSISPPRVSVINNVEASSETDPNAIREALTRQMYSPVLWVDCIKNMVKSGIEMVVESGPGKVLTGLSKRSVRDLAVYPIQDLATLDKVREVLN